MLHNAVLFCKKIKISGPLKGHLFPLLDQDERPLDHREASLKKNRAAEPEGEGNASIETEMGADEEQRQGLTPGAAIADTTGDTWDDSVKQEYAVGSQLCVSDILEDSRARLWFSRSR